MFNIPLYDFIVQSMDTQTYIYIRMPFPKFVLQNPMPFTTKKRILRTLNCVTILSRFRSCISCCVKLEKISLQREYDKTKENVGHIVILRTTIIPRKL